MDEPRLGYSNQPSWMSTVLGRVLAVVTAVAMLVVALMFSIVFFAIALTVGLLIFGRIWWKTRDLRKRMRENDAGMPPQDGRVIEGEVIRDPESRS